VRVCLLASGSQGNAIYIQSRETRLLIDAGLSGKQISQRLASIGVEADQLDAVLVSHEHQDHCRGVGPLVRRFSLPLYMHEQTRAALPALGRIDDYHPFAESEPFTLRDIKIEPLPVTHDAVAPVGFILQTAEGKVGVATDLGIATRLVAERLRDCRALVLETNHDLELLRDGPYPWHLKQRIRSRHGHLSNSEAADLLGELVWDGLDAIFLAHLSETNNTPEHASRAVSDVLDKQNRCRPEIILGYQAQASRCFECC